MSNTRKPIIGISIGDLNGVGMELIIKTFADPDILDLCTPVVFGSSKVASYHRKAIGEEKFNFHLIKGLDQIHPDRANLINVWQEEVNLELGTLNRDLGPYAVQSLEAACDAVQEGQVDALLTAPIHKQAVQSESFRFSGHTDYLEARFNTKATMMMVSEEMRMALATVHIPINKVSEAITEKLIVQRLEAVNRSLKHDFHLPKGRIAVLSMNPHAGDHGVIGKEDQEVVIPAIEAAKEKGILAVGPYPADSFFGSGQHRNFDAILAMYHDQGLIPFKALSFGEGVNYTAGLPIIRTSPDHGTAFDIAGKGQADPGSFRQALYLAIDLVRRREVTDEISANPLKIKAKKR